VINLIGVIPTVGTYFPFLDLGFIFGPERRCLHDLIADTKVVVAARSKAGTSVRTAAAPPGSFSGGR
jgi:hypothetical protein